MVLSFGIAATKLKENEDGKESNIW
jgi:hypothetical protein